MRININLATRPFADQGPAIKRLRIGMGVLALVLVGLGFGLRAVHHKADQARQRERSLDTQIARITQERQGYQNLMDRPDNAQLLQQAAALNRLFDEKAFSWTLAMENLETVLPGGVQVSTLEPTRAKDGQITLHLRVVGPRDRTVDLVRNLEHSRRFLLPRIVGETSESSNSPNQRLEPVSATNRFTFDVLADYNPPTPDETRAASKPPEQEAAKGHEGNSPVADPPAVKRQPARRPYIRPATGGPR
jgi:type IV pilus assembly protein PilN